MPKDFEGEGADILGDDVSPAAKKRVSAGRKPTKYCSASKTPT